MYLTAQQVAERLGLLVNISSDGARRVRLSEMARHLREHLTVERRGRTRLFHAAEVERIERQLREGAIAMDMKGRITRIAA